MRATLRPPCLNRGLNGLRRLRGLPHTSLPPLHRFQPLVRARPVPTPPPVRPHLATSPPVRARPLRPSTRAASPLHPTTRACPAFPPHRPCVPVRSAPLPVRALPIRKPYPQVRGERQEGRATHRPPCLNRGLNGLRRLRGLPHTSLPPLHRFQPLVRAHPVPTPPPKCVPHSFTLPPVRAHPRPAPPCAFCLSSVFLGEAGLFPLPSPVSPLTEGGWARRVDH